MNVNQFLIIFGSRYADTDHTAFLGTTTGIPNHLLIFISPTICTDLHCVSKNVPHLTCYNLYIHGSIATIFGVSVAEKVGNQNVLYFPASPN